MKKGIILLGSSNSSGDTQKLVAFIADKTKYPLVDLKTKHILPFDYEFQNQHDDFIPLMRDIVNEYDLIIFATPVYWYMMSGIMKTFFDRISDCLKIEKATGRKLRGMEMAVVSCGYDQVLKDGFYMPFIETANYLGMKYSGSVHGWIEDGKMPTEIEQRLMEFIENIQK